MKTKFEIVRDRLNDLAQQLAGDAAVESPDEWGGADVIIRSKPLKKRNGSNFYSEPRTVVTPHSRQLTWLFYKLRDTFYDHELLDHMTKLEFFGRLANAALRYIARSGENGTSKDLLLAVLHESFAILDELEEGTFECLGAAPGNAIADDFIEREEKRGFIGVEETKKFFEARGVKLP